MKFEKIVYMYIARYWNISITYIEQKWIENDVWFFSEGSFNLYGVALQAGFHPTVWYLVQDQNSTYEEHVKTRFNFQNTWIKSNLAK